MADRRVVFPTWKVQALRAGRLGLDIRPLSRAGVIGDPGDRIFVCESWSPVWDCDVCPEPGAGIEYGWALEDRCPHCRTTYLYRADGEHAIEGYESWEGVKCTWRSARKMPEGACRLTLHIEGVRAARVSQISEGEAEETGVELLGSMSEAFGERGHRLAFCARWAEAFDNMGGSAMPFAWGKDPWAVITEVRLLPMGAQAA